MEKAAKTAEKKRKLRSEELEDLPASSSFQLKTRRLADATPAVNIPSSMCQSDGSYGALGSSCSSNGSSDLAKVQEEKDEATVDQFLVTSNGGDTLDRRDRYMNFSGAKALARFKWSLRPGQTNPPIPAAVLRLGKFHPPMISKNSSPPLRRIYRNSSLTNITTM